MAARTGTRRRSRIDSTAIRAVLLAAAIVTVSTPGLHGPIAPARMPADADATVAAGGVHLHRDMAQRQPHDPATCPECSAIALARTLVRAPAPFKVPECRTLLGRIALRAPHAPFTPPVLTRGPRAPPPLSLAS